MAEVGIGLDAFDDHNAVIVGQLGVEAIEFGIARELAMLGEADRAQTRAAFDRGLDIFLGRGFRIIGKMRVDVKIDDHRIRSIKAR